MGFLGTVRVRLKATSRSTDLINVMKRCGSVDKKVCLLEWADAAPFSFLVDEECSWPKIFCQIIYGQLSREYVTKGKMLDSGDTLIVIQAAGYSLSQGYPNDKTVQQFLATLPFGV